MLMNASVTANRTGWHGGGHDKPLRPQRDGGGKEKGCVDNEIQCTALPLRHNINIINWRNGFDTRSIILTEYIMYSNVCLCYVYSVVCGVCVEDISAP